MLERVIEHWPAFGAAYLFLRDIYQRLGDKDKAVAVYRKVVDSEVLSPGDKQRVVAELKKFSSDKKGGKLIIRTRSLVAKLALVATAIILTFGPACGEDARNRQHSAG